MGVCPGLADADVDIVNYSFEVTFPASSSTNKAGLVFAHDGDDSFYAVVLDRNAGKIALHQITDGSWGAALDDAAGTVSDNTAYIVKVFRKQRNVQARVVGQSSAAIEHDSSADLGTGQSGLYSDKTDVNELSAISYQPSAISHQLSAVSQRGASRCTLRSSTGRPGTPWSRGSAGWPGPGSAMSYEPLAFSYWPARCIKMHPTNWLYVDTSTSGGEALVENFSDDDYMVEASISSVGTQYFWVRYQDSNNGYLLKITSSAKGQATSLYRVQNGYYTSLGSGSDLDYAAVKQSTGGRAASGSRRMAARAWSMPYVGEGVERRTGPLRGPMPADAGFEDHRLPHLRRRWATRRRPARSCGRAG